MSETRQKSTIHVGIPRTPIEVWILNPGAHSGLHKLTTIACCTQSGKLYLGVEPDHQDRKSKGTSWREVSDCWSALRQFIHMRLDVEARARRFERARDSVNERRKRLINEHPLDAEERAAMGELLQELNDSCREQVHWMTDLIRAIREPSAMLDRQLFSIDGLQHVIRKLDQEATRQYGIAASLRSDQATLQALIDAEIRMLDDMYFEFSSLERIVTGPKPKDMLTIMNGVPPLFHDSTRKLLSLFMSPHSHHSTTALYREMVHFKDAWKDYPTKLDEDHPHLREIVKRLRRMVHRTMLEAELIKVTEFVYAEEEGSRSTYAALLETLREVTDVSELEWSEETDMLRSLHAATEELASVLDTVRLLKGEHLNRFREHLKGAVHLM